MIGLGAHVDALNVTSVEGQTTNLAFAVKPLLKGDDMTLLEVSCPAGLVVPAHAHKHESLLYVLTGSIKTHIDGKPYVLRPGDSCRHPKNSTHSVEALEDSKFIEIKSPSIDPAAIFGVHIRH